MRRAIHRFGLVMIAALACFAALAAPAGASTAPTLTLNQSAGHTAGSTANLGLDLKFANSGTDSPQHLTIDLPPGLLANASISGGSCLKTAQVSGSACKVGSGTVTATADPVGVINVPLPVSVPVTFYLVPPPGTGDLAGLAVEGLGQQLGSTGEIKIRPTGDPNGVGVRLQLVLPNQLPVPLIGPLAQISLTEINSTFDGLRYPATCPATPARLSVSADSYGDSAVHTVTAPLSVTGCSSVAYSPKFRVTAARDSADRQVRLATQVTQGANEAPSRSVSLAFPASTLAPNLASIKALCLSLTSGSCTPVGSVTAVSPLYPTALSGTAYLTGSSAGLSLTLVFPSPFPLTLTGAIDLVNNSATFTGLPDIPLTNLAVSLNGGAQGLFLATCAPPSGTATATLTDQNGDQTVLAPSDFTVSGCPSTGGGPGGGGPGGGANGSVGASGGGGSSGGGASSSTGVTAGSTTLSNARWSGLSSGHPTLTFRLAVAKGTAKLSALTVELPAGISFARHRVGKRFELTVIALAGAHVRWLSISHGHLLIGLRKPVSVLTVKIGPGALHESRALKARARKLKRLPVVVVAKNTRAQLTTFRAKIESLPR